VASGENKKKRLNTEGTEDGEQRSQRRQKGVEEVQKFKVEESK